MKVSELPYRRVTTEEVAAVMEDVIPRIQNARSVEEILAAREDYLKLYLEYATNASLASMRYTINTVDEFYVAENEYYDEAGPVVNNYMVRYASALLDSPFRRELEQALSPVLFASMENSRKSMSEAVIEDMVEENKLVREYSDLMAGMEFAFRGETLPRAMLMKYAKDADRNTRKECFEVLGRGLEAHKASSWATTAWTGFATTMRRSGPSAKTCSGTSCPWWRGCAPRTPGASASTTTSSTTTA